MVVDFTAVCHCTDCQRQTGTSSSIVVGVPAGALAVGGPSLKTFVTIGEDHGTPTNRSFCSDCGSPIVSRIDAMPDLAFIKAGTLDDTRCSSPRSRSGAARGQPWEPVSPPAPSAWSADPPEPPAPPSRVKRDGTPASAAARASGRRRRWRQQIDLERLRRRRQAVVERQDGA